MQKSHCATQLSGIFNSIFQASLSLQKVLILGKTSNVEPVPKKSRPASPNDVRPVVGVACNEGLYKHHQYQDHDPSFRSSAICISA